jgi:PII-like signaling protein
VSAERLKLTTYFGERDPSGGGFLADALVDVYARHGVQVSALLRGIEGFGLAHALHTDRLLTASEDLPIVSVALDARERIEGLVAEVRRISGHGLITVEPAGDAASPGGDAKLMVFLGRKARAGGRPAYEAVTEILHACGAAGATVLLGVDGTFAGTRRRARFFGANADVPLVVVAVGTAGAVAAAVEQIARAVPGALTTVEDVRVCKRDGRRLAAPHAGSSGAEWQKLMVHTTDHDRLMARLRRAGGRGATALRGVWGFRGDHAPHGEAFWSLRRQVGVLVVIVDTPERIARAYAIVDELTAESGLVTSELVRRA